MQLDWATRVCESTGALASDGGHQALQAYKTDAVAKLYRAGLDLVR